MPQMPYPNKVAKYIGCYFAFGLFIHSLDLNIPRGMVCYRRSLECVISPRSKIRSKFCVGYGVKPCSNGDQQDIFSRKLCAKTPEPIMSISHF